MKKKDPEFYYLKCVKCKKVVKEEESVTTCPACKSPLDVIYDYDYIKSHLNFFSLKNAPISHAKYVSFFPIQDFNEIVSLREGGTPLKHANHLAEITGVENVYIKNCIGKVIGSNPPIVIGHGVSNVVVEDSFFIGALYLTRSNNTIVRNCVFKYSNGGYIISQDDPQWDYGWGTQDCSIYNNDFIVGGGTRFIHTNVGATGHQNLDGFFIKNNIPLKNSFIVLMLLTP